MQEQLRSLKSKDEKDHKIIYLVHLNIVLHKKNCCYYYTNVMFKITVLSYLVKQILFNTNNNN